MPDKMEQLLSALGITLKIGTDTLDSLDLGVWKTRFCLVKIPTLFVKPEPKEIMETTVSKEPESYIAIDDLIKVKLAIGTITTAEAVEKSDKMLKLQVDCGQFGIRQILSGIRKSYAPEELIGKQGIFVVNLKPRMILGLESQGMMLLAEGVDGKMRMATVADAVPTGALLR